MYVSSCIWNTSTRKCVKSTVKIYRLHSLEHELTSSLNTYFWSGTICMFSPQIRSRTNSFFLLHPSYRLRNICNMLTFYPYYLHNPMHMCQDTHIQWIPISGGHVSSIDRQKPIGRVMDVFRELKFWPRFHIPSCCAGCNVLLICTAIYRECLV